MNKTVLGEWGDKLGNIDKDLNPNLGDDFAIKKLSTDNNAATWKNIVFTADNAALYLGKIPKDRDEKRNGIYNKDAIKRLLEQLLPKVPEGQKLTIFDASDLSWSVNQESKSEYLDHDQIVDLLEDIADDVSPHWADKINVIKYSDKHPRLFEKLQTQGIGNFLDIADKPELTPDAKSLELFTYLARLVQQPEGKELAQYAEGTLPKQLKHEAKESGKLDSYRLYSLCEIACRIRDLMAGRYIQWGMERQVVYDRIIEYIVSKKFQLESPLDVLQQYILTSPNVQDFVGFYYSDETNLKNKEKQEKQKNTRSKIRNAWVIALFSLMSVFGYKSISNFNQDRKIQAANEKIIEQRAGGRSIVEYIEPSSGLHMTATGEDLKKLVQSDVEYIKKIYRIRFGSYGDMSESQFEGKILDNLTYDALYDIHRYMTERDKNMNIFIDEKLIPNSVFSFTVANTPMQPYAWLADREADMINTLRTGKIGAIRNDYGWYVWITGLPAQYIMLDWEEVEIIRATEDGSFAVRYSGLWKIDTALTHAVIIDYFLQTRPWYKRIAQALEKYLPQSRQFDYRPQEDRQWREKDKIEFFKHLVLNNADSPPDDPLLVVRFLKNIFVDHTQWLDFAKKFERYNMFGGSMMNNDTTLIRNTQDQAGYEYDPMINDIAEFDHVMTYPYVWYGNDNTLWFYTVVIKKVAGKYIYLAKDASRPSRPRNAGDACMVYSFLHEDM